MRRFPKLIWAMTAVAVALMLAPVAMAGGNCCPDEGEGELAELDYGRSDVRWQVFAEHVRVRLTVSTPCGVFDRVYDKGEAPSFDIAELGEDNPNGQYTWQIRIEQPVDAGVQKALKEARQSGDDRIVGELRRKGLLPSGPFIQTGEFTVIDNAIVPPGELEKGGEGLRVSSASSVAPGETLGGTAPANRALAETVISGDLTVYNSLCVGFDCLANEAYGADTIRLKENNLRIHVEDTSTAAGFPTTDWRLEFNSQSSGGGGHFRVIDVSSSRNIMTLEAGAPSNSLVVDNGGRLGLGTANPVVELHVANGDTPTLRLEQTTGSGFEAQTWDVAGNETNFFVRDVTNGSTLPFRIRPGASSNALHILADNSVGIGTASPSGLQVNTAVSETADGSDNIRIGVATGTPRLIFENDGFQQWQVDNFNGDFRWFTPGVVRMVIEDDGDLGIGVATVAAGNDIEHSNGAALTTGGVWADASSRSYKQDIEYVAADEAMNAFRELVPVSFRYKQSPKERYIGFIAEDVPDLVAMEGRKNLAAIEVVALLTKVVQEQQDRLQEQEDKIQALTTRVESLGAAPIEH